MSKYFRAFFFKTSLSAFRTAILTNDINRICQILDVEHRYLSKQIDHHGNTALLFAIQYSSLLTIRILLEQGAQPDQVNSLTFQTPLYVLSCQEFDSAYEIAQLLLEYGAYVDKPSTVFNRDDNNEEYLTRETPLMTAVRMKNHRLARLFLENKANVNYCDKQTEHRPIHFAIANGDFKMFDLLETAGANCRSIINSTQTTLLHWFCSTQTNDQHTNLLRRLIDQKCDLNAENHLQQTPLMLAAKLNMINTVRLLVKLGADSSKIDCHGERAIDLAPIDSQSWRFLEKELFRTDRYSVSVKKQNYFNIADKSTSQDYNFDDSHTKHKRMWDKLMQTKDKIRLYKDSKQDFIGNETGVTVKL